MGREVRMVPANWEHPKDAKGHYEPLFGRSFSERLATWKEAADQWSKGFRRNYASDAWLPKDADYTGTFEDWDGPMPEKADYMPDWPKSERTHIQMYETATEGTPISPVMEKPEELARWLADNNASASGGRGATYEQWLAMIKEGWAPSMASSPETGLISGVEDAEIIKPKS